METKKFQELSNEELSSVNGGGFLWVAATVNVVTTIFVSGVIRGYREAAKKK